jgi:hypothetical protein
MNIHGLLTHGHVSHVLFTHGHVTHVLFTWHANPIHPPDPFLPHSIKLLSSCIMRTWLSYVSGHLQLE